MEKLRIYTTDELAAMPCNEETCKTLKNKVDELQKLLLAIVTGKIPHADLKNLFDNKADKK